MHFKSFLEQFSGFKYLFQLRKCVDFSGNSTRETPCIYISTIISLVSLSLSHPLSFSSSRSVFPPRARFFLSFFSIFAIKFICPYLSRYFSCLPLILTLPPSSSFLARIFFLKSSSFFRIPFALPCPYSFFNFFSASFSHSAYLFCSSSLSLFPSYTLPHPYLFYDFVIPFSSSSSSSSSFFSVHPHPFLMLFPFHLTGLNEKRNRQIRNENQNEVPFDATQSG